MSGSQPGWPGTDDRNPLACGLGELGIRKELEQVAEFVEIVALPRVVLALQVRK